jgi:hypothetical protein
MMLPRYSLYGDYTTWNGNIQEDLEGRWLKWKDTEAYVQYALAHGYTPPAMEQPTPAQVAMVNTAVEQLEMYALVEGDVEDATIIQQANERFDDEV